MRIIEPGTLIGRVHSQTGRHPTTWDGFRHYGPTTARFDHQPPPPGTDPIRGISYAAVLARPEHQPPVPILKTCLAESFQNTRLIDLTTDSPAFVLFRPNRALRLLDLADGDWLTAAGGNAAICSGPRDVARAWARAIYDHYPQLDGLYYSSATLPPGRNLALTERGQDAVPELPAVHRPLNDASLRPEIEHYAADLRYGLSGG